MENWNNWNVHYFLPTVPKCIYNPITAMEFLAMFTFQLDNTKGKLYWHPIAVMGIADTEGPRLTHILGFGRNRVTQNSC